MRFVKISPTQFLNLDRITRIEVYETQDIKYTTVHFQDGESYRCTEEESVVLLPIVEKYLERIDL